MFNKFNIAAVALVSALSMNSAYAEEASVEDIANQFTKISNKAIFSVEKMDYVEPKDSEAIKAVAAIQDQALEEQEAYKNSWSFFAKDKAKSAAKWVGGKLYENADYYGRLIAAWNLNYYCIEGLETVTASVVGAAATVIAGPAAGSTAYYTTKSSIRAARWVIPGFEGYFSGSLAPVTKALIVDPVIDYGPSVAKSAYSAAKNAASGISSGAKSFYNWWTGSAA